MAKAKHTIRIISGTHRSRLLPVLDIDGLRPTGDRVRETLFNWLQLSIAGKTILDVCAGTGALGFEAASRGAKQVTMIDNNHIVINQLKEIKSGFGFDNVDVVHGKAQQFLLGSSVKFDVVFIDPPFVDTLQNTLTEMIAPVINRGGYIYREAPLNSELNKLDKNWQLYRKKTFGQVKIELWKKSPIEN